MASSGTQRRLPPDERRAQPLAAARRSLAASGTQAFTTAAAAKEAGVTQPLLRHYFGTRDGLLVAVAQQLVAEVLDIFLAGEEGGGLRDRLDAYLDFTAAQPWAHATWMHAAEVHPDIEALVDDARRAIAAFSFGLAWTAMTVEAQLAGLGWVGYVESVVAAWIADDLRERAALLDALMEAARRLGVRDL